MGQVALGFRSLLVRAAVFFVMAALLAWALGGTLWPRAVGVKLDEVSFGGKDWVWRAEIDESLKSADQPHQPVLEFSLWTEANETPGALSDYVPLAQDIFTETLPLLVVDDELIVAAFQKQPSQWKIYRINAKFELGDAEVYSDRLAIVQEWTRLSKLSTP
ncbi:MAG: hypothetical protein CMJ39_09740 [Phycisphaerae bacterium]|nr:hypothetical protein [Phycisphaerae bacterium]|tara:strand:- start:1570 stop:2052 length:483 start_codon:yes stop_codon:yes gene_type:complete